MSYRDHAPAARVSTRDDGGGVGGGSNKADRDYDYKPSSPNDETMDTAYHSNVGNAAAGSGGGGAIKSQNGGNGVYSGRCDTGAVVVPPADTRNPASVASGSFGSVGDGVVGVGASGEIGSGGGGGAVNRPNQGRDPSKDGGGGASNGSSALDSEEALLDLAQLEELHQEAERMKAVGNKHMAAQEYTRAYNAYSAALQLSPVGPSSHVFLSNRAAALLSLKRYGAAATDARRAVALAPTFGKAHARLGQALYFLKNYDASVTAYQDALRYEPDNAVTITYLDKARQKLEKHRSRQQQQQQQQQQRFCGGGGCEDASVAAESCATQATAAAPSVVTTDHRGSGVVTSGGYRGDSSVLLNAAASSASSNQMRRQQQLAAQPENPQQQQQQQQQQQRPPEEDPDFDEAVKIQRRANRYLSNKQYRSAIEEYTAALFLCPDDPNLSPELHLGRAHALNGSRRHESARIDAEMAIQIRPSFPSAHATLAKSLFYMRDYRGAVTSFERCEALLPESESLGMFDRAYLHKARAAAQEEDQQQQHQPAAAGGGNASVASAASSTRSGSAVPRLPPPRFVPREEAIQAAPNIPPMPKQWPVQTPHSPTALRIGPERDVHFLSESLGIKLNRGADGVVRVLTVSSAAAGSPVLRNGRIDPGDVVREAAGVDMRRPITNIMWGDTVALIKMAPRPITLVVAKELSEVPASVLEEQRKAAAAAASASAPSPASRSSPVRPSPGSDGAPVAKAAAPPPPHHPPSDPRQGPQRDQTQPVSPPPAQLATVAPASAFATTSTPPSCHEDPTLKDGGDSDCNDDGGGDNDDDDDVPDDTLASCQNANAARRDEKRDRYSQAPLTASGQAPAPAPVPPVVLVDEATTAGASGITEEEQEEEGSAAASAAAAAKTGRGDVDDGKEGAEVDDYDDAPEDEKAASSCVDGEPQLVAIVGVVGGGDNDGNSNNKEKNKFGTTSLFPADEETATVPSSEDPTTVAATNSTESAPGRDPSGVADELSPRDMEEQLVGGEILFERPDRTDASRPHYAGWDNLRWMSYSGARRAKFCQPVFRLVRQEQKKKKALFWQASTQSGDSYVGRTLVVYEEPPLILVLRRPAHPKEIHHLLGVEGLEHDGVAHGFNVLNKYWVVDSVADPAASKLRLSPLTTVTSLVDGQESMDDRRLSCLELRTPTESIVLSAVRPRQVQNRKERSFADSGAFLETTAVEMAIAQSLCEAHRAAMAAETSSPSIEVPSPIRDLSWKHQIVLGSLHAVVLSGDQGQLERALAHARQVTADETDPRRKDPTHLPSRIVDAADETGFSPLCYAVAAGMGAAVQSLVAAGASVDFEGGSGITLLHLAAQNLDVVSLSTLLAAAATGGAAATDPNALTVRRETPMYLATTQGRLRNHQQGGGGGGDAAATALRQCLQSLEAWGGRMLIPPPAPSDDGDGDVEMLCHPVRVLASRFAARELAVVLEHLDARYPLQETWIDPFTTVESKDDIAAVVEPSVGALCHYPIHGSLLAFRRYVLAMTESDGNSGYDANLALQDKRNEFMDVLALLLDRGFEPNERLDCLCTADGRRLVVQGRDGDEPLSGDYDFVGWSPLQILASVAADFDDGEGRAEDDDGSTASGSTLSTFYLNQLVRTMIGDVAELLVRRGARLSLEAPLKKRPLRRGASRFSLQENTSGGPDVRSSNKQRSSFKLDSNRQMVELLGGQDRLLEARNAWTEKRTVCGTSRVNFWSDDCSIAKEGGGVADPFAESIAPGGNSDRSCAICWKTFGTLMNRKHRCRTSRRYVCDECSGKRIVWNGTEYRVSDGQFSLASNDVAREQEDRKREILERNRIPPSSAQAQKSLSEVRRDRLRAEEQQQKANRDSLFGGMLDQASNYVFGGSTDSGSASSQQQQQDAMGGIRATLEETRNAFGERGEKLSALNEKSAQMVEASKDFASMAKELRKKSEGSLFW